jgi:hypothetical protein
MKKLFVLFALIGLSFASSAQDKFVISQVNFNAGKTFSTFLYEDINSQKDTNISYTSGNSYALNIGMNLGAKHLMRAEINYSELGAKSRFLNDQLNWKLNYLGFGVHYIFHLLQSTSYSLSTGAIISFDYLLKGEQNVGDLSYNLKETDALKTWNLSSAALLNGRFKVTESLSIMAEYRFGIGINQIEKKDLGEKTRNLSHKVLIGLSFNISQHE